LFVSLEATFTYIFWAFKNKSKEYGASFSLCPWQPNDLEYDGLCSHNALGEGIVGDYDATEEEPEAQAVLRKAQLAEKKSLDYKVIKAKDPEQFNARCAVNAKSWRENNPGKTVAAVARHQQKTLAKSTFHCTACNKSFPTKTKYRRHMNAKKLKAVHASILTPEMAALDPIAAKTYHCKGCDKSFPDQSKLTRHMNAPKFKAIHDAMSEANDDDIDDDAGTSDNE
jgi:transposase-like protein